MDDSVWWLDMTSLTSGLVGILVGLAFPGIYAWRRRHVERKGELAAMHVEMRRVRESIDELLSKDVQAPLYRLPLTFFTLALPKLIGEGNLDLNEIGALVDYVSRVEEINRGLDRAGDAHAAGNSRRLADEFGRNRLKGEVLLRSGMHRLEGATIFDAAESALFRLEDVHAIWKVAKPWYMTEQGIC